MQRYVHIHRHASLTFSVETNFLKYFGHLPIDKAGRPDKGELKWVQRINYTCSPDLEPDLTACLQASGRKATPPSTFTLCLAVDAAQDPSKQEAACRPWPDRSPSFSYRIWLARHGLPTSAFFCKLRKYFQWWQYWFMFFILLMGARATRPSVMEVSP